MRSFRAKHNEIAVSANARETDINVAKALDTTFLVDMASLANLDPRRESNVDESTGREEPDTVYDLGKLSLLPLSWAKAQPQHYAFIFAYGLGLVAAAGAGSGYEHVITPIIDDLDRYRSNPSFTALQRYGKTVAKRRLYSMFVDGFTAEFPKDDWCKLSADCRGTGKFDSTLVQETVTAAENETQLTLDSNGVQGATAEARLDSVHQIKAELTAGVWTEVGFSAVSSATPAVITITAPGGTTTQVPYKILYTATEPAWATLPSRPKETPLRVSQTIFNIGGAWDGSAFQGGRQLDAEINSVAWNFANNTAIEFTPGAGDAHASRSFRDGRVQTLSLDREFRDYLLQNYIDQNETFGFYVKAQGAEYEAGHNYQIECIFPKVGILKAPIRVDGKRNAEAGDLIVMEHDTHGSVIAKVKNLVSAYAA